MLNIIKKAQVLIEALPYIKKFANTITVIKFGGSLANNNQIVKEILKDIIFLRLVGINPVLVHGSGPHISARMQKAGLRPKFIQGLRITNKRVIKIVKSEMKKRNAELSQQLKKLGGKPKSLCGKKNKIVRAKRLKINGKSIGFVGEVTSVNTKPIIKTFKKGEIPVITPLGLGHDGKTYNINADQTNCDISASLKAEKFILITDVNGIRRDESDETTVIPSMQIKQAQSLIRRKIIKSGMIPKVKSIISALKNGVKKTHIIDGRVPHAILLEIFTDKGIGTEIIK